MSRVLLWLYSRSCKLIMSKVNHQKVTIIFCCCKYGFWNVFCSFDALKPLIQSFYDCHKDPFLIKCHYSIHKWLVQFFHLQHRNDLKPLKSLTFTQFILNTFIRIFFPFPFSWDSPIILKYWLVFSNVDFLVTDGHSLPPWITRFVSQLRSFRDQ